MDVSKNVSSQIFGVYLCPPSNSPQSGGRTCPFPRSGGRLGWGRAPKYPKVLQTAPLLFEKIRKRLLKDKTTLVLKLKRIFSKNRGDFRSLNRCFPKDNGLAKTSEVFSLRNGN